MISFHPGFVEAVVKGQMLPFYKVIFRRRAPFSSSFCTLWKAWEQCQ